MKFGNKQSKITDLVEPLGYPLVHHTLSLLLLLQMLPQKLIVIIAHVK